MTNKSTPTLYSFRRCPYAMRARMALVGAQQQVELREVLLRDKPAKMLEASPKATVPVLVLGTSEDVEDNANNTEVLEESLDIMLWALHRHDPQDWLLPEIGNLAEMLKLISRMDGDFKHHLDNYKYANRHAGDEEGVEAHSKRHRNAGLAILQQLDHQLQDRAYLFGSRLTLADVAIAPFIRQFANTDIDWFNAQDLPYLQTWLRNFLEADLFTGIMEKFVPWTQDGPGVPFPADKVGAP